MKKVTRDPVTGRFVSEAGNKIMKIKEVKPKAKAELDVTLTEAKSKTKSKVEASPEASFLKYEEDYIDPIVEILEASAIVQILEANYGIKGSMIIVTENVKLGKKASNKMAGSDPAPKQKKVLVVKALVGENEVTKEFNEGEVVAF